LEWLFDSQKPIYSQLIEHVQLGILTGEYPPGSPMPSVRVLAIEAGVNPNTMQRALSELETRELLHTYRTAGRFVTEDRDMIDHIKREQAERCIDEFFGGMERLGFRREEAVRLLSEKAAEGKKEETYAKDI
jgi:DNA-binding transcriptional regulator YhcF (GntR family)